MLLILMGKKNMLSMSRATLILLSHERRVGDNHQTALKFWISLCSLYNNLVILSTAI